MFLNLNSTIVIAEHTNMLCTAKDNKINCLFPVSTQAALTLTFIKMMLYTTQLIFQS